MTQNLYSQLPQGSIRLLRLLPSEGEFEDVICTLFEYPLQNSYKSSHPYEALSYCWESEEKPEVITVNDEILNVTRNLHKALVRLRDHACSRVLWIDAICINQDDVKDKEKQLPLMAEIFARANRVVVWLGDAEDGLDKALELISLGSNGSGEVLNTDGIVEKLFERPWFHRVWILQEMAAARQILIMCGSSEVDGHAFCLGLDGLQMALSSTATRITILIREAIFRPRRVTTNLGKFSRGAYSLGELIDMYQAHKATKIHDKVYALLGMCSDNLDGAGLEPNYDLPWRDLLQRVIKFLFGDYVSVDTWNEKPKAIIKSKGWVLGKVSERDSNDRGGSAHVVKMAASLSKNDGFIQSPANNIQEGDLVCLLQGALSPMVIRSWDDHFQIVAIRPSPLTQRDGNPVDLSRLTQSASFVREFFLVWDWESLSDPYSPGPYIALEHANNLQSRHAQMDQEIDMNNAINMWNAALILEDVKEFIKAEAKMQIAEKVFEAVANIKHTHSIECRCSQIPLLWVAKAGNISILELLLAINDSNVHLRDGHGRTSLSWVAGHGHLGGIRLLLETGNVKADVKDYWGQTPLSWAAANGHENAVRLLVERDDINADAKDEFGQTPLSLAAMNGHEAVVRLLVERDDINADAKDEFGQTPLSLAATNGHEAVVRLLVKRDDINADAKDNFGQTSLSSAAMNGHEAVVRLLVERDDINADAKDNYGQTPLSWAAKNGHEAVVRLLVERDDTNADAKDEFGQTPLLWAAMNGHEAVVRLLVERNDVNADAKDNEGRTPLWWAVREGHEAVVRLLVERDDVNADAKDNYGGTPLLWAAENGHEAVVRLLVERNDVNADAKDNEGRTPLWWAVREGHEAVVRLLVERADVNADAKDIFGQTPLLQAAKNGHEAVVRLLKSKIKETRERRNAN